MPLVRRLQLTGHFKPTSAAAPLFTALRDAETGYAQRLHGAEYEFVQPFETKDSAHSGATPGTGTPEDEVDGPPEYQQPQSGDGAPVSTASATDVEHAPSASSAVADPALPAPPTDSKPTSLLPPPPLPARAAPSTLPPTLPPRSAPAPATEEQREDLLAAAMEDRLAVGEHDGGKGSAPVDEKAQVH